MRSSPVPPRDPSRAQLGRLVKRLEAAGDVQGVIRLVEAWDREGEPSLPAILAQARAFLALHLMDRAWVRLRQAEQLAPEDPTVLALTARVFIARGWPARARKVVDRLAAVAPEHAELAELAERSRAAAEGVPADARELESTGDAEVLKGLAERYIAAGSLLRARTLLERVRRADPYDLRAELLLWGLQGEFLARGTTLATLTSEHGRIDEWETIDHTESIRRSELQADPPTAEVTRADLVEAGMLDGPAAAERFPSLFRQTPGMGPQADDEDEVTVATRVAAPLPDDPAGFDEGTDPGRDGGGLSGGDTQIMQVIPGPGGPQLVPVEGPAHTPKDPEEGSGGLRQTLDLKAWQQSMGMQTASPPPPEPEPEPDDDYLEAEDEDLVVLTRREDDREEEAPGPGPRKGPIEVIEKHPEPPPDIGPLPDAPFEELAAAARPGRAWLRLGAAVALMLVVMGGATLASVRYLHHLAGEDAVEETGRALASGGYDELLQLQARLDAEVAAETAPLGARAASLALVEAVLWGEYTGRPEQRTAALDALALARDQGASDDELAVVEGTLALLEGDIDRAARASHDAGLETGPERGLAARVALSRGQPSEGLEVLGDSPEGARDGLLRVALLDAAGREADANAALAALPQDAPLVRLHTALREVDRSEDGTRHLVTSRESLRGVLSPRQLGSLFVAEAELADAAGREGDADVAWKRALSVDGHNPAVLYRLGASALIANEPLGALREFQACAETNPWYLPCRRGAIEALLDLDRLDQAAALAGDEPSLGFLAGTGDATGPLPEHASVLMGLGWSRAKVDSGKASAEVDQVLAGVMDAGSRSADPLDRRAAGRAAALRVTLADEAQVDERVDDALALGDGDPLVHVRIAQRYEALGRKAAAAQHLARATRDGPENALAWHARGQFYFEPATMAEATWAWQKYLELDPSGPRATKARGRVR
ncbi:MAG: hypothetical protein H6742_04440 [Alphaproteobacteria bacterium]|nr:hypothetical protein [Alphaproteobacteria bacterium]